MLSTAAWNAFLKTLEEPPPHTIFVLATTEAQKVLPTVVDRCHRFDFARPSVAQIAGVLRRSPTPRRSRSRDEAMRADRPLAPPARSATRSARSSSSSPTRAGRSTLEDVLAVLGVADADLLFGAVDAVAARDAGAALRRGRAARRTPAATLGQLLRRPRGARARRCWSSRRSARCPPSCASRRSATRGSPSRPGASRRPTSSACSTCSPPRSSAMKDGADARTQLELALVKAAAPSVDPSTQALLARIERLEGARRAGAAPSRRRPDAAPPRPGARRPRRPRPRPPTPAPRPEPRRRRAARAEAPPTAAAGRRRRAGAGELSTSRRCASSGPPSLEHGRSERRDARRARSPKARPVALADDELTLAFRRVGRVPQAQGRGAATTASCRRARSARSPAAALRLALRARASDGEPEPRRADAVRGRAGRPLHGRVRRRGARRRRRRGASA